MNRSKRYTDEFKTEAVKQIVECGYSVNEVAERLSVYTKTFYQWRSGQCGSSPQIKSSDEAEIVRLKTELDRATKERDTLKKAALAQAMLSRLSPCVVKLKPQNFK